MSEQSQYYRFHRLVNTLNIAKIVKYACNICSYAQ